MKKTKRMIAFLVMILALASVLAIGASAEKAPAPEDDEISTDWVLSADGYTMTRGKQSYTWYDLPNDVRSRPYEVYEYYQTIRLQENDKAYSYESSIGQPYNGGEVSEDMVYLYYATSNYDTVYVTANGKRMLDSFVQGNYARYELCTTPYMSQSTEVSENMIPAFRHGISVDLEVSLLEDYSSYYIIGYDETLSFVRIIGEVFDCNGNYYYFHYDELENYHFTADGTLSLRRGTAPAYMIPDSTSADVDTAVEHLDYFSSDVMYEGMDLTPLDGGIAMGFSIVMFSPLLFVLPCVTLILGTVLACLKAVPHRRGWLAVALLSLLWLLLSTFTSIALIVAFFFI